MGQLDSKTDIVISNPLFENWDYLIDIKPVDMS